MTAPEATSPMMSDGGQAPFDQAQAIIDLQQTVERIRLNQDEILRRMREGNGNIEAMRERGVKASINRIDLPFGNILSLLIKWFIAGLVLTMAIVPVYLIIMILVMALGGS